MQYLDFERLETIDEARYQAERPFPWINPQELLTDEAYAALRAGLRATLQGKSLPLARGTIRRFELPLALHPGRLLRAAARGLGAQGRVAHFLLQYAPRLGSGMGGHTVLLDDGGQLAYRSSPAFEDFHAENPSEPMSNRSLLFSRTDHAWHGVRPVDCREGNLRKVFIVVVNSDRMGDKLRRAWQRRQFHYY